MSPEQTAALERLRSICLALPEVEERESHRERLGFWCPAAEGVRELRIEQDPDTYLKVAPMTPAVRLA